MGDSPLGNSLGKVADAAGNAFGSQPLGLSPDATQALRDWGVFPSAPGQGSLLQMFNEGLISSTAAAGDGALRGLGALYRGGQTAAYEALTGAGASSTFARDVVSIPD